MNMHPSLHHQFEVPHGVLEPPAGVFLGSNLRDLHHIEAPPVWMRHSSRSGSPDGPASAQKSGSRGGLHNHDQKGLHQQSGGLDNHEVKFADID